MSVTTERLQGLTAGTGSEKRLCRASLSARAAGIYVPLQTAAGREGAMRAVFSMHACRKSTDNNLSGPAKFISIPRIHQSHQHCVCSHQHIPHSPATTIEATAERTALPEQLEGNVYHCR